MSKAKEFLKLIEGARFKKGDTVVMSSDALDNYGSEYKDVLLVITHVATSKEDHPGYDSSMKGMGLYDLNNKKTGKALGMSLYDWELRRA
jgi:hypothetical protein